MKILLIGELCWDDYHYGKVTKINAEAPTPVLTITRREEKKGMAGNVDNNLISLRPNWHIDFIHQNGSIFKTRFVDEQSGYILLRSDEGEPVHSKDVFNVDKYNYEDYDGVVISSYNKGFINQPDIHEISKRCAKKKIPVFLDCKFDLCGTWAEHVTFIKINEKEYNALTEYNCKNLIITMGQNGVHWDGKVFPSPKVEVQGVTGAGDVFLACFVVKYLENIQITKFNEATEDAIKYAIKGASYSVTQKGTTVVKETDFIL